MSYKSLLFCPDEKSARLVTQVLSELDFTVEIAGETFPTVKKLTNEHFDALVVDCQNEQDASVLFKAARNSSLNHSSLSVAVVEGQAGVAQAFRIGANLVLTKPINVEQSKSTLRVARGLLKKSQAKPAGTGSVTTAPAELTSAADSLVPSSQPPAIQAPPAFRPAAPSFAAAASTAAPSPTMSTGGSSQHSSFSALEVEKETTPATEASDAAVLDSLPQLPATKAAETSAPAASIASPFVTSVGSGASAAAAAPALEKPVEVHAGAAPLVTNEPIVKAADLPEAFEAPAATPTFASLGSSGAGEGSGGKGFLKIAAILLVVAIGGYFGWQKLQSRLHKPAAPEAESAQTSESQAVRAPAAQAPAVAQSSAPSAAMTPAAPVTSDTSNGKDVPEEITAAPPAKTSQGTAPENIEIQEMPFSRDAKVTVTPKPAPLVVKSDTARIATPKAAPPIVAPSLDVAATNSSSTIANLITTGSELPKPGGAIRISQGVSQGLLMKKVSPAYPPMALQLRKEGVVELLAKVSKEGRITNVKVVSGDSLFVKSATDAVKQWQYRPYLLNGQPLEIETQISISFKLPK